MKEIACNNIKNILSTIEQLHKNTQKNRDKLINFVPAPNDNDWFDIPTIGNTIHLMDITRPIGVQTIGSSLRNGPSYDIRVITPLPNFIVSPWARSTIEPDRNIIALI